MRKSALVLIATLLISIPAVTIGNVQIAVSPTALAAGPVGSAPVASAETLQEAAKAEPQPVTQEAADEIPAEAADEPSEPAPLAAGPVTPAPVVHPVAADPQAKPPVATSPAVAPKAALAPSTPVVTATIPHVQSPPALPVSPPPVIVTPDMPLIDASEAHLGIVTVNYAGSVRARLEVRMGETKYYYNIYPGQEHFPLQIGNGQYTVTVFEKTTDNRYRAVGRSVIDVAMANPNAVFLASIQEIKWTESSLAVSRARQITSGLTTDRQKFEAVYRFVVNNIDYDTPKLATLTSTYLPNVDETLTSGKGICYDHASLMAAMLRSLGIPTKLVKGYATTVQGYHAWNEVYVDGEWLIVDASVDAQRRARGAQITMIKTTDVYRKTLEF